jgi:hypothetical protein
MRTAGTDCKKRISTTGKQNRFPLSVPLDHPAVRHLSGRNALREIGSSELFLLSSHIRSFPAPWVFMDVCG